MRKFIFIIFLLSLISYRGFASNGPISEIDAVNFVKSLYNDTVNQKCYSTSIDNVVNEPLMCQIPEEALPFEGWLQDGVEKWLVFVDEKPDADWCHDCSYYYFPKYSSDDQVEYKHFRGKLPPDVDLKKQFDEKEFNRRHLLTGHETDKSLFPEPLRDNIVANDSLAGHIYVLLFNGGIAKRYNYIRFWNNLSYIYQTLVNVYDIPKANITVLSANGGGTVPDTNIANDHADPVYIKQNLDLDNDGLPDINGKATVDDFWDAIDDIANTITSVDHFFLFVTDHGASFDNSGHSYICPWYAGNWIDDNDLDLALSSLNCKSINVVLGQCYSGGFIEECEAPGRIIATSCAADETSYSNDSYTFFLNAWTSAVESLTADTNNDGHVSMSEAYTKANLVLQQTLDYYNYLRSLNNPPLDSLFQHPRYSAIPATLGESWAFNSPPKFPNLYVRDNTADTGAEPNTTTTVPNKSPDIGISFYSNLTNISNSYVSTPIPSNISTPLYVYVNVSNIGDVDYLGTEGKYLHLYWSETQNATSATWLGQDSNNLGGPIASIQLSDTISLNQSRLYMTTWAFPQALLTKMRQNNIRTVDLHVLAHISDSATDVAAQLGEAVLDKRTLGLNYHPYIDLGLLQCP